MSPRLAPCRVCGHLVSEFADRCPGCGDPTARRYGHEPKRPSGPWTLLGWLLLILIVLPIAMCSGLLGHIASQS